MLSLSSHTEVKQITFWYLSIYLVSFRSSSVVTFKAREESYFFALVIRMREKRKTWSKCEFGEWGWEMIVYQSSSRPVFRSSLSSSHSLLY